MWRRVFLAIAVMALAQTAWAAEKIALSRISSVTVYPNNALVTREVEVPEGIGPIELVVTALPEQTVDSSLYSEGNDAIRILTTRYRMRPIKEDTREEVRKAEAQLKKLTLDLQKLQSDIAVIDKNLHMLGRLEEFTGASLKTLTEKGLLNGDTIITLAKYVMDTRAEKSATHVTLQQQVQDTQEQIQFVQRKLQDLAAGSSKIDRDAVIVVDKKDQAAGKIRLNYLVSAATWRPQYKLRADKKETKPVQIEYLAAVVQHSGEDWGNVQLLLSTAQPMLNATPPDLKILEVAVLPRGAANPMNPMIQPGNTIDPLAGKELNRKAMETRVQAQAAYTQTKDKMNADLLTNSAAALEQTWDLLSTTEEFKKQKGQPANRGGEGPSITYTVQGKLSIPSRNDEQIIEIAKLDMMPEYYYKAVPVLTQHVYRLANLTNKSACVLLPGEATMYIGTDFVGRADLPLVAIGEQFTAGFGVDPQLQVQRQLLDKSRATQGDNQVWKYNYRILVSSYKNEAVKLQVWDRLPHGETEAVGVTLGKTEPSLSGDPLYLRESRPNNLLRWDLSVEPTMNGEKAFALTYDFKLELGRAMMIGNILAK